MDVSGRGDGLDDESEAGLTLEEEALGRLQETHLGLDGGYRVELAVPAVGGSGCVQRPVAASAGLALSGSVALRGRRGGREDEWARTHPDSR